MSEYTPKFKDARRGYAARFSTPSGKQRAEKEFDRFLDHERAEAIRYVATGFIDWYILYGHSDETDKYRENMKIVEYLMREANKLDGKDD